MLRIAFVALCFVAYFQATKQQDDVARKCYTNVKNICKSEAGVDPKGAVDSFKHEDVIFRPNKEYLKENCEKFFQYVSCVTEKSKTCPAEVAKVVDKHRKVLNQLCDENSNLRKAYVEHLNCLKGINGDVLECKYQAEKFVGDNYLGVNDTDTINCLKIAAVINSCLLRITKAKCSEKLHSYDRQLIAMLSYVEQFGCTNENIGLAKVLYRNVKMDPSFNATVLNAKP